MNFDLLSHLVRESIGIEISKRVYKSDHFLIISNLISKE
jgi:hypothetical protein